MRAPDGVDALFVMPPGGVVPFFSEHLGTAFLRAMLARAGIASQQYLPERNVTVQAFARFLAERRPAIVGFTAYESNLRACRAMARAAREALPEAVLLVGGPNATFTPEETLELIPADACLRGAGEGTIVAIAGAILGAAAPRRNLRAVLGKVPNLVVRTAGGVHRTRVGDLSSFPSGHFRSLDELPSPYQQGIIATADVGYLTSRGCNQHCTFCSFAAISRRKVHYHGVERVLEDLAAFKAVVDRVERRRSTVSIFDDAFSLAPERARMLCEGIVRRGLQMPFDCETRADRVDADLLRLMKRAGFVSVAFGVESAVPRILRAIGKVQDPETNDDPELEAERAWLDAVRTAVAAAKDAGLTPTVSVIGGLPGETADDFRATLAFVASLDVPTYAHNVLAVMPGTPLHRDAARHGMRAERDAQSGSWRTYHAYEVDAVAALATSDLHADRREEAQLLADALCGRPRAPSAADDAAWAVVFHATPGPGEAAWLQDVLAVHGAVVVLEEATEGRASDLAACLETMGEADVPWGRLALLSHDGEMRAGAVVLRSLGTLGEHRFVLEAAWPAAGCAIESGEASNCRVPLWIASRAAAGPPPLRTVSLAAPVPQIADGCRWWSGWRRCRRPPVLHVAADGAVRPCWNGPAIGRVGDAFADLTRRGEALVPAGQDTCPLGGAAADPAVASAAESYEVAAQVAWLLREAHAR
jgi:radical SAM superfamily enzyme YgiQ (UPF0313 family)